MRRSRRSNIRPLLHLSRSKPKRRHEGNMSPLKCARVKSQGIHQSVIWPPGSVCSHAHTCACLSGGKLICRFESRIWLRTSKNSTKTGINQKVKNSTHVHGSKFITLTDSISIGAIIPGNIGCETFTTVRRINGIDC